MDMTLHVADQLPWSHTNWIESGYVNTEQGLTNADCVSDRLQRPMARVMLRRLSES